MENFNVSKASSFYAVGLSYKKADADIRGKFSLDTLAKRWNCDKSKVRRFLKLLESDSMIELKSEHITTRLTICKYDTYQGERNADETQVKHKRNASETQMTPNKNDNNEKKERC
jgi:hypothetical protein